MRDIILESIKKVRMFESSRILSEALTPEEEKELQSIAQEVIRTAESGVDGIPPEVLKAVNDYKSSGKTDTSNKPTDKPSGPSGTQVQTDDDGNHMITTPDGKTMVVGPDGKPLPNGGKVTPAKPTDKPTDKPTPQGTDKVGPANPGTKAIQHYLNTKHGQKLDVDGRDGPLTSTAIRNLRGKVSTDEYTNIAGLAYAYNVKPGQGPGTVSLGNPEFVKRMTALGYDPKTGNPVGGGQSASPAGAGAGQGASPTTNTGIQPGQNARDDLLARQGNAKKVNTADTQALENSIKAIEAILAKNKTKSESIEQTAVLENISQFSPREQMEIWKTLSEADLPRMPPGTKFDRATGNYYTTNASGGKTYIGGLKPQQSKLAKFASKMGGSSGIGRKIAARAGASALAGPAAAVVGAGMLAWTAYDVGKALYDTFKDDEIASMDPADQELIKKHMAVILQYQKNSDMMGQLPPELKTRLESALKGLDQIAATADTVTDTDTDIPSSAGAGVGAAAAKAKQVAGGAVDSTVDAGNKFAAGVKQGYNQQAASPSAGGSKSSTSSSELRIAGAPVVPGQPLSQKQIAVMKMSMDSGNSYPPEVMAQYNKQNGASSTKESITQSEDDTILAMIRAVR